MKEEKMTTKKQIKIVNALKKDMSNILERYTENQDFVYIMRDKLMLCIYHGKAKFKEIAKKGLIDRKDIKNEPIIMMIRESLSKQSTLMMLGDNTLAISTYSYTKKVNPEELVLLYLQSKENMSQSNKKIK